MENKREIIVIIENEPYLAALPAFGMYEEIFRHVDFHIGRTQADYLRAPAVAMLEKILGPGRQPVMRPITIDENGIAETAPFSPGCQLEVHPILIPLDKNGAIDLRVLTRNRNGSITKGGTLFLDNRPIQSRPFASNKELYLDPYEFHIGDTVIGMEMSWLLWDGCLFSLAPVAAITSQELTMISGYMNGYREWQKAIKDQET